MIIVFPCSSDSPSLPDSKFLKEALACEALGIEFTTVNLRLLMASRNDEVFRATATSNGKLAIYRGGTLRLSEYRDLYEGLANRGIKLLTSPTQFASAQLFPEFFPKIADLSLPAVTTTSLDPAEVRRLAIEQIGPPPYFLKDYVKSAKENWPQGCVVPAPGTVAQFAQTIAELREFRGERFESGLVIRPLVKLRSLGLDPFGDECCEEYRLIFLGGQLAFAFPYGYYAGSFSDFARFDHIGRRFDSPFFMADCAVTEAGDCYLLETGDGGCCGLPPGLPCAEFYRALQHLLA